MSTATMTTKGQVTIPADVRQRLGLDAGDRIEFVLLDNGEYAIRPAIKDVRALKGMLRKHGQPVSVEEMNAAVRRRGSGQ